MGSRFGSGRQLPLLSKEDVRNSPSRRDGISEAAEKKELNRGALRMYEAALAISNRYDCTISVTTIATGIVFLRRFYSRKSLKRNDCFVISTACLFLACKACDQPYPHMHVAVEMFRAWFGREREAVKAALNDPGYRAGLSATVLDSERAVLFTIGFDFNVPLLHTEVMLLLQSDRFRYLQGNTGFLQAAINCCNDLLKRDGGIVLQYTAREVAVAIFYFIFKCIKGKAMAAKAGYGPPPPDPNGRLWWLNDGVPPDRMEELIERVASRYQALGHGGGRRGAATPADSAAAAAPAESQAGGSAATAAGPPPRVASPAEESTAERPLEPAPAAAELGAEPAREAPPAGAKRRAPEEEVPAGAKRARGEPEAAPPPAADSEPEEGEIEEGELPG